MKKNTAIIFHSACHARTVEIRIGGEAGIAVQHKDLVVVVGRNELVQPIVIVAEIHHVDGRIVGCQVGHKAVGIAVLDDQDLTGAAARKRIHEIERNGTPF